MATPKKKILITSADADLRTQLTESIHAIVPEALIVQATDGSEASLKILNDPPQILIIDPVLPKMSGQQLTEWLIAEKPDSKIAIILLSKIPQQEQFVDQVAKGQIQFLEDSKDEAKLKDALVRASAFVTPKQKNDIKIRKVEKVRF